MNRFLHCLRLRLRFGPFAAVVLAIWIGSAGCGRRDAGVRLYPVQGAVFFDDQPATGALVVFHPQAGVRSIGVNPRAYVANDGTFQLTSDSPDDGAPAGEYRVTVSWYDPEDEDEPGPNRLPGVYSRPETSRLVACIVPGPNVLTPFRLSNEDR